MREIGVGLLGLGNVGSGVLKLLSDNAEAIERRLGARVVVRKVAVREAEKRRLVEVDKKLLTTRATQVIDDPGVEILVELIGGEDPAREYVRRAIEAKKHVVTANKLLLAMHGDELFALAEKHGRDLYYEASVCGGLPIIRALREGLASDTITEIYGIVNGTSNYTLTTMTDEGKPFDDVLRDAQEAGYAEADPALDVDGGDASHKLAILMMLCFGTRVRHKDIYVEGIRHLTPADFAYAERFGYIVKPLVIAKEHPDGLEARVHPTMIPANDPLAAVSGAFNAVCLHGDALGRSMYYGQGAGMMPTATAVLADVLDVARDLRELGRPRLAPLGYPIARQRAAKVKPIGDVVSEYYLRVHAQDEPGVLGRIASLLGQQRISIASVTQRERSRGEPVPIVIRTHEARERDLRRALDRVARLPSVSGKPVAIRIEENPG